MIEDAIDEYENTLMITQGKTLNSNIRPKYRVEGLQNVPKSFWNIFCTGSWLSRNMTMKLEVKYF